jgi:hypothetical protein
MAKRICKGNIDEEFVLQVEGNTQTLTCRLLDFEKRGEWSFATFADSYFPDGRWGKWKVIRFKSGWVTNTSGMPQRKVTVVK